MKVVHLMAVPTFTGAAEPALDLASSLRDLGVEVDVHIDTRRPGNLHTYLEARGFSVPHDLVLSTKAGPLAWIKDFIALRKILSRTDIVHVHLSHDHALAEFARRAVTVVGSTGSEPSADSSSKRRPRLVRTIHSRRSLGDGLGRRWILRKADALTVASREEAAVLTSDHRFSSDRIAVLPGSVDPARFHPDPEARARVRSALGLDDAHCAIGCVARFQAGRRHELLIEAVARARAEHPELRLVLIGHGERESALREAASQPGLGDAVVFAGYHREDLNDYLAALDAAVWLVPGNDATSRAVLQAMAVGLPVVGGSRGAIAEAVIDGETGWLVDPSNALDIARALSSVAESRERRYTQGEAGRLRALQVYSPAARARHVLQLYELVSAL